MKKILLESHYFPNISYMSLFESNEIIIDTKEKFQKQTFRSRCQILGSNNLQNLSIPVTKESKGNSIREVKIDYDQSWLNDHWRSIQSCYGKSPFYEYFIDTFHDILFKKHTFLYDLNQETLTNCLQLTGIDCQITESHTLDSETLKTISKEYKGTISPKNKQNLFQFTPYHQNFGSEFVPNLSVLDLLFCEGPNAISIIQATKA